MPIINLPKTNASYKRIYTPREITRITSEYMLNFRVFVYQTDGSTPVIVDIENGSSDVLNIHVFDDTEIRSNQDIQIHYDIAENKDNADYHDTINFEDNSINNSDYDYLQNDVIENFLQVNSVKLVHHRKSQTFVKPN